MPLFHLKSNYTGILLFSDGGNEIESKKKLSKYNFLIFHMTMVNKRTKSPWRNWYKMGPSLKIPNCYPLFNFKHINAIKMFVWPPATHNEIEVGLYFLLKNWHRDKAKISTAAWLYSVHFWIVLSFLKEPLISNKV